MDDITVEPSRSMAEQPIMQWELLAPGRETRELVDSARAHFASLSSAPTVRGAFAGERPFEAAWVSILEQGYPSIGVPEELDGLGSMADLVAVLEEAGSALLPLPLLATVASFQTLLRAGITLDLSDEGASALALDTGEHAIPVFDGGLAEWVTVVQPGPDGTAVRRVTGELIPSESLDPIDPSRAIAYLVPDVVLDERILAEDLDWILAPARICVAADLVGTARSALELAIEHARTREQFGRPIGAFQAVKHLLADGYVALERARSLTVGAAAALIAEPDADATIQLSMLAKAAAADSAVGATALRTQLLGAMGLTFESDNHLQVRRARQTAGYLGAASELYAQVATRAMTGAQHG